MRDASAILTLLQQMADEAGLAIAPASESKMMAMICQSIAASAAFVAVKDRRVIGTTGGGPYTEWWSDQAEFAQMWWYVLPDHRPGGPGVKLLRLLVAKAKEIGIPMKAAVVSGHATSKMDAVFRRVGLSVTGRIYQGGLR